MVTQISAQVLGMVSLLDTIKLSEVTDLEEDQFLLKLYYLENRARPQHSRKEVIITRLNKNGTIPKKFLDFRRYNNDLTYPANKEEVVIYKEDFFAGWKFKSFRYGSSRTWVIIQHPYGFDIEISDTNFAELMENIQIKNGILQGKFKHTNKTLLREPEGNKDVS